MFTAGPGLLAGTQRIATLHARLTHEVQGRLPMRLFKQHLLRWQQG